MLKTKIISSLEKPFTDECFDKYSEHTHGSALLGETYSLQMLYTYEKDEENRPWVTYTYALSGTLAEYATVREVKNVGVQKPVGIKHDDNYLRTTAGIYPDVLAPFINGNRFVGAPGILNSIWIDIEIPTDAKGLAGEQTLELSSIRVSTGETVCKSCFTLDIIDCSLPPQKTSFTMWTQAELLAKYYGIAPWSKKHWQIMENALTCSRRGGANIAYAPIFTTVVSTKTEDGFKFDYKLFDKWISLVEKLGFDYIEMSHLFSPGSAAHASPEAFYYENGATVSMKGRRATDPDYVEFIRAFIKGIIARLKRKGLSHKLLFHIADEPSLKHIEYFRAARESVIDIIGEYPILDAIFDIEYWHEGLVSSPVPITDHLTPFLEEQVPHLWTYYCTGPQADGHSNRFIAQSGACHRSLGMQLYKYNIEGFLHYALCYIGEGDATGVINPYVEQSGNKCFPAGDTFCIYPTNDGEFLESIRLCIIRDAFQDIRAMQLLEGYVGHGEVVRVIEEELGTELKFNVCAKSSDTMLRIRERINRMIKDIVKEI